MDQGFGDRGKISGRTALNGTGNDLPQVVQVLKAKFGDEFEEKNVRRASKQSYTDVIVGIPEKEGQ